MKLELMKEYAGFKVNNITPLPDINATAYQMEHEYSGAKLLYLDTTDDNKVFTIGFPTPSQDDTGVAHITEHSVLCGSRKYHLKEPFVELVKGSLNTFLNAMTYSDKTVYPVASRNDKDFHNLMDVYLDAVFYPLIYDNPFTLAQEGWHYELNKPTDDLTYNGVVYNEMKGAYSTADTVEENEVNKALFPDSPYRFESGGYPDAIPTLTQEMFTNFHKTHYSPENSFIYLYGDMDILATLAYMDKEYLSKFPKTGKIHFQVPLQEAFMKTKEIEATYPIPAGDSTDHKTYLSMNIVTSTALDTKRISGLRLLNTVLLDGNDAPLRLALVKAGIGSDISGSFSSSLLQPIFSIRASGAEGKDLDKFVKVIYGTLQEISRQGIDKKLLTAQLNAAEFKLREADFGLYPKGLIYGLSCYDTWLYGGDPLVSLRFTELMDYMRKKIDTTYFEHLIETQLLDNTHKVLLTLRPEPGKEEKKAEQDAAAMAKIKASFTAEQINKYSDLTNQLHARQQAEDAPADLASIPVLQRADIKRQVEKENYTITQDGKRNILYLPQPTNKIIYATWKYDITGITPELMPYAYFFIDVLGKVNTKDFTYQELPTFTNTYTGGVYFDIGINQSYVQPEAYSINFKAKAKVLQGNLAKLFQLLSNLALSSDFTDKTRIKEILAEVKTDWDNNFFARGQSVATARLHAYFSNAAKVEEQDQLSYYLFIKDLWDNFEEKFPTMQANLQKLAANFFHQDKQLFAFSCEEAVKQEVLRQEKTFTTQLPHSDFAGKPATQFPNLTKNEGITTSGKVQYVLAGGDYRKHGYSYTGAMKVLETILRYGYLWTKIRVQGGAYGANAFFSVFGFTYFSSYRDPNLVESLEAYRTLPDFLANFTATDREMTKYVIGTISGVDIPLTYSLHLDRAVTIYVMGLTEEDRQLHRDQILDVTVEDIRALAPVVKAVLDDNYYCVVGSQSKVQEQKAIFSSIKNV